MQILQSWRRKPVEFTQTVRIVLLFFSSPSHFVAVLFFSFKKCMVNCTSVLLVLFFISKYIFQRKSKSGIFDWFYCLFSNGLFKTKLVIFWLGPITSTLKIIMDVQLNFWAKFQNCPNNCPISFYDASLDPRFVFLCLHSRPPVLATCASSRASSLIGISSGLLITAHKSPYLFFSLSNCTCNSHITKNENLLAYYMRIFNSCVV